jgi:hypothetical protein
MDAQIQAAVKKLKLKAGKSKTVKLKLSTTPNVEPGNYTMLARVTPPDGTAAGVGAASSSTQIAAPFVTLAGTFTALPTLPTPVAGRIRATLALVNNGNILATGKQSVQVFASTDEILDAGDIQISTVPLKLKLKPASTKLYKLKLPLPISLSAGTYKIIAVVPLDPDPVVSPGTFQVV